ncbi:MAG: V-type ATPase subunit [Aerococcaceae bacterium]|nr:V-type ATPase subunit [Aerococcaceae bacterium]
MNVTDYSAINTTLSVKERTFLTKEQLMQLIDAKDDAQVALLLQATDYELTEAQLADTALIEAALMKQLARAYRFAFEETPQVEVVELFAMAYMYHNLKILGKMKATQRDLASLCIPIGRYSLETLQHLMTTLQSERCEALVVEEVAKTWQEYLDYGDIDAIDMGFDSAYFRQLRTIATRLENTVVTQFVDTWIDFFNIITVKRALEQHQSQSFMYQLLSRKGTQSPTKMIECVRNNQIATWFETRNPFIFESQFQDWVAKMKDGTITASELEQLRDLFVHRLLEEGRFETQGALPLLRYLNGKELEIKNLRLILTGRANGLSREQILERMRPVYGE